MRKEQTLGEVLAAQGVSRRGFMKFCASTASLMALPPTMIPRIAAALEQARRPSVIWLPFQECTGCTESITRSHAPSLEGLIFDTISLDYQETIMAAAGHQAEEALAAAMKDNFGKYVLAVDGSIPTKDKAFSCIAGKSNYDTFVEAAKGAAAIVAVGSCASFGGIPAALPNPTGAKSATEVLKEAGIDKPVINISGCPPIPTAITGVLAQYLTFGQLPESRPSRPPEGVLRAEHPRPLLSPPVLRARPVRRDVRRRGREEGLVPLQARLQGPRHLQRLRHDQVEPGCGLPDRGRPRLPRLRRTGFLGLGRLLQAPVAGTVGRLEDSRRSRRGGRRDRPRVGGRHAQPPGQGAAGG